MTVPLRRGINSGNVICCHCCNNRAIGPPTRPLCKRKARKVLDQPNFAAPSSVIIQPWVALELRSGGQRTHVVVRVWLEAGRTNLENLLKAAGHSPRPGFSCNLHSSKGPSKRPGTAQEGITKPGLLCRARESGEGKLLKTGQKL